MPSERERIMSYLIRRAISEFDRENLAYGVEFIRIHSTLENMDNSELEMMGVQDAVGA